MNLILAARELLQNPLFSLAMGYDGADVRVGDAVVMGFSVNMSNDKERVGRDLGPGELVQRAVTQDLFGAGALTEPAEVVAPEKYELKRCLGRGGFGIVYLAYDRVLARQVALKFLLNARPADVERLRREARYAARLNNPAIVQVYDFGEEQGQPYIVMQYIDGGSLGSAELELTELVATVLSVADALAHAHQAGIVHRDIKPANILLDREKRAYLSDFGIARDLVGVTGETLSMDGAIIGTPELMSPEQARGELRSIDARSDIYSLGATLYTQLTGRMPFGGSTTVDILHGVIHDHPPLPRSIAPSIPRGLEAIVLRSMQKEKRNRYANMREVVADLERYLAGDPNASEGSAWFRTLVGAPLSPAPESKDSGSSLTVALEVAREISAWDANLYRVSTNIPKTYPPLDSIILRLDGILAENPDVAWARFYRGAARFRRGYLRDALEDMERSISRMSDQAGAHFELGRLYLTLYLRERQLAHRHISGAGTRHHLDESRSRLEQAVIAFKEAQLRQEGLPLWQVDYAQAVERLAEGDPRGCVALCDRLLEGDPDVEELWKLRGDALRLTGADPLASYDRALEVRRSYYEALFAKAEVLWERGEIREARESLVRALEIDPEFTDGVAFLARLELQEAQKNGDGARLAAGLELLERGLRADPQDYELTVTQAEVLTEIAKMDGTRAPLEEALKTLERAADLEGCGNRVQFLAAMARRERARLVRSEGGDPRADLKAILTIREQPRFAEWANERWRRLMEDAETELENIESR